MAGIQKSHVVRHMPIQAGGGGVNVHRTPENPHGYAFEHGMIVLGDKTARCVVNSRNRIE